MSRLSQFAAKHELWLSLGIGVLWWIAMHPGLFAEDSMLTLGEARSGPITVWFSTWWIYLIRWLTLGTRVPAVMTLIGVVTFCWAVRTWAAATFNPGPARAWMVLAMCASPLVGAIGVQLRHDAWMTAGLLLWTAVIVRTGGISRPLTTADVITLAIVAVLLPTRHNGLPTLAVAGVAGLWFYRANARRYLATVVVVGAVAGLISTSAARAAGYSRSTDPAQTVEWLMADVSCLLSRGLVIDDSEWRVLERVASRQDWVQPLACRFVNPIQFAASYRNEHVDGQVMALLGTFFRIARQHPADVWDVHSKRVGLFLPPYLTGPPDRESTRFIHGTVPNPAGLEWTFPRLAWTAQLTIRLWNKFRVWLANGALWLLVLGGVMVVSPAVRARLWYTALVGTVMLASLLVTAPVSEGRYVLFVLVCGHAALLHRVLVAATGNEEGLR